MRYLVHALGALALALAACSPGTAERRAEVSQSELRQSELRLAEVRRHPESGLPVVPLSVTHGKKRHRFQVEVARTGEEQARGLMHRTRMGADEGMIFPMQPPRMAAFWMRNTVLPLDIIFIGEDGRILNIAAMAEPYSEKPLPSAGRVKGVLELNGGRAAQLGIAAGDMVEW